MELVDAHCHLAAEEFGDSLPDALDQARGEGVSQFVTCGTCPEDWESNEHLGACYADVVHTVGIHPWFVCSKHLDRMADLAGAARHGAVAIGEIGLDKKVHDPGWELQTQVFEAQLEVADALSLPVVLHCRGAFAELLAVFDRKGPPRQGGMVHAFSGTVEDAEQLIALGFCFSMGGALSYRNSKKRARVLERIYPEHLMLETDSPDMPPVQMRGTGKPNVPANIRYNLEGAAQTLGIAPEDVARTTTRNARRVLGL